MTTPKFPDHDEDPPIKAPVALRTKAIIAAVIIAIAVMIILHLAHVFGP